MTAYAVGYRATVYAGRSVDSSEATILTPAAGAAHSDSFKVATLPGLSGWQPYLGLSSGRKGRWDFLKKTVDTGALTLTIQDQRVTAGGSNVSRWVTAFLGNSTGAMQLLGLKVKIEETLDGGTTWANYFTGRIVSASLEGALGITLQLRDMSDELDVPCYVGKPHGSVSYAVPIQVLPVGLGGTYGDFTTAPTFTGATIGASAAAEGKKLTLSSSTTNDARNLLGELLRSFGIPYNQPTRPRWNDQIRLYLKRSDTSAEGEFQVGDVEVSTILNTALNRATAILIKEVDSGDGQYLAMPANGTTVEFAIRIAGLPPTAEAPLYLDDHHPAQELKDLLDGKFSALNADGTVRRTFPYDSTAMTAILADNSFPYLRRRLKRDSTIREAMSAICAQSHLGWRMDASGQVVVFDTRLPQTAPTVTTLTDADLAEPDSVGWDQSRDEAISRFDVKYYEDDDVGTPALQLLFVSIPGTSDIREYESLYRDPVFGNLDVGDRSHVIDADGLRLAPGEVVDSGTGGEIGRTEYVLGHVRSLTHELRSSYGGGPSVIRLRCRRTANVTGADIGSWRIITCSKLPNPGTNARSGSRLARVIERTEQGPVIELRLLDAGPNAIANAPTVGALAAGTDAQHQVNVPITLNAQSDPVVIQVAITNTATGTEPASDSRAWVVAARVTASATVTISNMPANTRVWVRARSEAPATADRKLPSAWTSPGSGNHYLATSALTAPSGVTNNPSNSPATTATVSLTWTPATTTYPVEVQLVYVSGSGASVPPIRLPAGSSSLTLNGLVSANTVYTPQVREVDGLGGSSSWASAANLTIPSGFTGPTLSAPTITLTRYA